MSCSPGMRRLILLVVIAALALGLPATALGHAVVIASSPTFEAATPNPPAVVQVQFSETVQLLSPEDLQVVDGTGAVVSSGQGTRSPEDATLIEVPVREGLPDGTYTVRFKVVSADSHIIGGARAFAVGPGPVDPPFLGGGGDRGPSATSAWAVSARFLELVGLGGLLGLLAFRWLVWGPVWSGARAGSVPAAEREAALGWGRDVFWVIFGTLAVGAMLAEGYLLITYSATALGTTVLETLQNTSGVGDVLATTRFGSLLQVRGALLFGLFAIGAWQFLAEFGSTNAPKPATAAGARIPAALMTALVLLVLYGISSQGHASQAPMPALQITADLIHLGAVAVWMAGLAILAVMLYRLPRIAPVSGPRLAAAVLQRFSGVALIAVAVVVLTGVVRSVGQLSDPAQLWQTDYGQSILIKLGLLWVILLIALWNRRVTNAVALRSEPPRAALTMVRRAAIVEFALALTVVLVAALLVAQVPGRV